MASHLENSPTFSLQRRPSEKVILHTLSNLHVGDPPARNIVFATSLTEASAAALTWVIQNLARRGDAVHLAHVVRTMHARLEVYHSGPGNAFTVGDSKPHHELQDVVASQSIIKDRFVPLLEEAGLGYDVHLFVDTENAPPDAVGSTVLRLATELESPALVLAANDATGSDSQRLGSLAAWVASQQQNHVPVVLVRRQRLSLAPQPEGLESAAAEVASAAATELSDP